MQTRDEYLAQIHKFFKAGRRMTIEVVENGFIIERDDDRRNELCGSNYQRPPRKVTSDLNQLINEIVTELTYQRELHHEKETREAEQTLNDQRTAKKDAPAPEDV